MAALTLIIAKNEELVLPNGSAKRTSELIPVAAGNTTLLIKWIAGKIGIRALKLEPRSVNLVGARFSLRRDNRTDGLTKFRVVILMNNLRFLDGVKIRIHNDDPKDRILIVCAIQLERGTGKVLPIRFDLLRTLRVFAGGVTPVKTLRSGGE